MCTIFYMGSSKGLPDPRMIIVAGSERFIEEHDRHNAFCVTQGSTPMPNPGKRKHHDRYAEGGISCICLIAVLIIYGVSRDEDEATARNKRQRYLFLCRSMVENRELSRPHLQGTGASLVVIIPPPESRKCCKCRKRESKKTEYEKRSCIVRRGYP